MEKPQIYKVKKGKSETYLKDDRELQDYLIRSGIEQVLVKSKGKEITGAELSELVRTLIHYGRVMDRVEKKYDPRIVKAIVRGTQIHRETLADPSALKQELEKIKSFLKADFPDMGSFTCDISEDVEHTTRRVVFRSFFNGANRTTPLDNDFVASAEMHELNRMEKIIRDLGEGPFQIWHAEKRFVVKEIEQARDYVLAEGKRGLTIQRYKGLGEMNPHQLWDTTMNPQHKTPLKLSI